VIRQTRNAWVPAARWLRAGLLVAGLALAAGAVAAQVAIYTPPAEEEETQTFTVEEVRQLMVANGVSEDVADAQLARFPPDRTFTQAEIELLLQVLRPEEAPIVPGQPGTLPKPGAPGAPVAPKAQPPIQKEVLPEGFEEHMLMPFGYDLFRGAGQPTTPPLDVSVGPDYVLGVGDQVLITLWGDVDQRYNRLVDRQGRLVLPEVGVVTAAGRSLGDLRAELQSAYGRIYRNFNLAVSLGEVRTIQVYVSGDVRKPGGYTVSALSTAFSALFDAGGPTYKGSLRSISVSRRDAPPVSIDLYGFLLSGDRSLDAPLQSGDVVHVHPLGPTIKVFGEVRRPAIYEIREGETLRDAIAMAGGLTPLALTRRITVDRYSETEGIQVSQIDWGDSTQNPPLRGGDEVTVFSVFQAHPKEFVEIRGVVQYPGIYRLVPGMRVADLIFRAGGPLEGAYLDQAEIARQIEGEHADSLTKTVLVSFPLREVLENPDHAENRVLRRGDKVFVRAAPGWAPPPVVTLQGEVRFAGKYGLQNLSERVSDVVNRAGGLTADAFPRGAKVFRQKGRIVIDLSKALTHPQGGDNIALADGDSVYVPRRPDTVKVSGAVPIPGLLVYVPGKKANYYIEKTGGLTEKANPRRIKIIRVTGDVESARRRLWRDPIVQEGDEIRVEVREESKPIDWGKALREATTIIASLATTVYVISSLNK
jgi:protein involved in polysaccharide export with SLBB domain